MNHSDPTAALTEMKRTEALLRDARSVLRRVDALAAIRAVRSLPRCGPPPSTLVSQLAHRQHIEQRSAKQVARRLR